MPDGRSEIRLDLTNRVDPGVVDAVRAGLLAFNASLLGDPGIQPLAVLLRDADERVSGGLVGRTGYGWMFIEFLFVPAHLRGQGLGGRMIDAAEAEAKRRGCIGAWLDTFSAQALMVYQSKEYGIFGAIEDYPPGNTRFFLRKRF